MAAAGLCFFLHSALVYIKLSLMHLQCSLFILLMSLWGHWAVICLSLLIAVKNQWAITNVTLLSFWTALSQMKYLKAC